MRQNKSIFQLILRALPVAMTSGSQYLSLPKTITPSKKLIAMMILWVASFALPVSHYLFLFSACLSAEKDYEKEDFANGFRLLCCSA
jgi:hypothetical protein